MEQAVDAAGDHLRYHNSCETLAYMRPITDD